MNTPFRSAPLWWALTLALPAWAGPPDDALRAADPDTPVAVSTLVLPPAQRLDTPDGPADLAAARALWREANQRVAEFPRGHIDLLRWEAAQADTRPAPARAASATPLGVGEVLRASLRLRPGLFTHAGMNPLEQARVRIAYAEHVREVQHAWIAAVAARERARLRAAVLDASRQGSELGRRMVRVGNWPAARLMQEQAIEAAAWQASADAELAARDAIERLAGLMGLWQAEAVAALAERLPPGLPALPERADAGLPADGGVEAAVLRADPLLALEREPARRAFAALPDGRWRAWDSARDAALQALPEPGQGPAMPPHIDQLGLLRDARLQEAEEQRARLIARASERRAMARSAWARLQASHAFAQHAERHIAGLADAQQQESQQRYNGMFDSTWQLLASARQRLDALDTAQQARAAGWRAQASWRALLAGAPYQPDTAAPAAAAAQADAGGH
ncbi:hypothetical protein [Hydrogenophaga sp. T2]|uniref:hypothetical protein n=1 Tax=Hydrogenophaga sp. T2 TaxID=3132823 RepID=UPI003CF3F87E